MPQVAKVLQASAVVDGTVSEVGGQVEVKLRLFREGSDSPEWTQAFFVTNAGFGSLRRDSALSIANAVKVAVSPRILERLTRSPTVNTQAFDAFTLARQLHERAGLTDLARREEYERTIVLAPSYAAAYAALARLHVDLGGGGHSSWAAHMALAKANALKAIGLDSGLAEAHVVLGQVAFQLDWDWEGAREGLSTGPCVWPELRRRVAMLFTFHGSTRSGRPRARRVGTRSPTEPAL